MAAGDNSPLEGAEMSFDFALAWGPGCDQMGDALNYSRITAEMLPRLFAAVRETIAELNRSPETQVALVLQAGDLVEGLCGSEELAARQNVETLEFIQQANIGAPFLFTKGNHDVTGPGAAEAFGRVFHP